MYQARGRGRSSWRAALAVLAASAVPAAAQPHYTFTVIADTSDCYNVAAPVLANTGEAAFIANCGAFRVVRKGDGTTLTDVYVYVPFKSPHSLPDSLVSINDLGAVAFSGGPTGGGSTGFTILYGDGGPLTIVADTSVHTQWSNVFRPSINNAYAVAFGAVPAGATSLNTVIRADAGGGFTTIAQPGMVVPHDAGAIHDAAEAALNDAGQVEFLANTTTGLYGIYRGAGGVLTRIVSGEGNAFSGINNAGRVAFASGTVVRSGDGGPLTTVAISGAVFRNFDGVAAINNLNTVAFGAQTQAGPRGIFVGDGVVTQPVVQTGDVLPGLGTVTWVGMTEEAINDDGQVAFVAQYDDGVSVKSAIIRADPFLPQIAQLKLAPTVVGCRTAAATVTLDRPAPRGGVVVSIDLTTTAASAPATLTIPFDKVSGRFVVSTIPVTANEIGTLTVTLGTSVQSKPLTVRPIAVKSLVLSPNPVTGGTLVTGTATLDCPAAPDGITVTLSSNKPAAAQPRAASIPFPAGTQTVTFEIDTSAVAAATTASISATANGITKKKGLRVNP